MMRIITKLQILGVIFFSIVFTSCGEDDEGTGISEVNVTSELLIGQWNIGIFKVGEGIKTAAITRTITIDDGTTTETEQFANYTYTLNNDVGNTGDYAISFLGDATLSETDLFNNSDENIRGTVFGNRLFENNDTPATLTEYESAFFDDALNVSAICWEIDSLTSIFFRSI